MPKSEAREPSVQTRGELKWWRRLKGPAMGRLIILVLVAATTW